MEGGLRGKPWDKTSQRGGSGGLLSQPGKWWLGSDSLPMDLGGGGWEVFPKGGGWRPPYCGSGGGRIIEMSSPKRRDAKEIPSWWPNGILLASPRGTICIPLAKDQVSGVSESSGSRKNHPESCCFHTCGLHLPLPIWKDRHHQIMMWYGYVAVWWCVFAL